MKTRKTISRIIIIILVVVILACLAVLAWSKLGDGRELRSLWPSARTQTLGADSVFSVDPAANTPAPSGDATPAVDLSTKFTYIGSKKTAAGELPMYKFSGGYLAAADPYSYEFDAKVRAEAYGIEIIADNTVLGQISMTVLRYALSPEELTHFKVQMAMPDVASVLTSLDLENEYANWLRTLTPEQYDAIVNEALQYFYDRFWNYQESTSYVLENITIDEVTGDHSNARLKGNLRNDNTDRLYTFVDMNGRNFVSSEQGFRNTYQDAGASYTPIDVTAWVDFREGGTWKWKPGGTSNPGDPGSPTPTPTPTPPAPTPTPPPTQTPHKDPGDNPDDPTWGGPLTPGHDTDPYEPERPVVDPQPQQPPQTQPQQPPPAVVQPAEDCNGNGSTADEQASAVREDLAPAPAPVVDSSGDHPAQAPTQEVAAQPEVPAVSGGFTMPAIDD